LFYYLESINRLAEEKTEIELNLFGVLDHVTKREIFRQKIIQLEEELKSFESHLTHLDENQLNRLIKTSQNYDDVQLARRVLLYRSQIADFALSIQFIDRVLKKQVIAYAESGDISTDAKMTMMEEQNVMEASITPLLASAGRSRNAQQGQEELVDMSDFLERPVEIYSTSYSSGAALDLSLDVWALFLAMPAVRAKLRNYAYLRGNLHVKVSVAGTPFHYGRIMLSYQPFASANNTLAALVTAAGLGADGRRMLLNYMSQAPGSQVINVNQNKPVEVVCPYISPQPMGRLFNYSAAVLSAATSFTDFSDMGTLLIKSINNLAAVSASPTPVYIQVYAWMEDVQLGTTTGTQIEITTESGVVSKGKDERKVGPVENIASRVFDISSRLTKIPYLYPYAKASEIASGAVRNVAALFGWSMPVLNQNTMLVRNNPFCNGALTIGSNTSQRIVLDPLQELSVDSTIVGVEEDDMIISNIASRMTYLTTFNWNDTDSAMVAPIWTCENSPNLVTYHNNGVNVFCQPTAMSFAALPFTYWRGSITYRFEIVCSSFHRGRLAFYFEPNVAQRALINASVSMNKQFIRVVDIQDSDVVDITVGWASSKPWLRVGSAQSGYLHTDQTTVAADGLVNGYISVIPFTSLQSPDASDIKINVYVCCSDLQVNGRTNANMYSSRLAYAESGIVGIDDKALVVDLNNSSASNDGLCEDYFGEQPLSFRSILKRFTTSDSISISANTTTAPRVLTVEHQILPPNNLAFGATSVTTQFTLFSYLRPAYVGMRGSVRIRCRSTFGMGIHMLHQVKISLSPPSTTNANSVSFSAIQGLNAAVPEGTITFAPATNSGIEVEFPFYSNNLFVPSFSSADFSYVQESTYFRNWRYQLDVWSGNTTAQTLDIERAAGEDFTFLRFQGAAPFAVAVVS